MVEHLPFKQGVESSILSAPTPPHFQIQQQHLLQQQGVESSIISALNLGEVRPVADCSQVQIGVVYPQNELRGDPCTVRRIGRAVEDLVCASLDGIILCPPELAIVTPPGTAGSDP